MPKKNMADFIAEEHEILTGLISTGTQRVRKINPARILLKAAEGWTDEQIQASLDVSIPTIEWVRQRFVEEGLERALVAHRTSRMYPHLLDGTHEAHLLALVCSQPPRGHRRWSLRLLASEMVMAS